MPVNLLPHGTCAVPTVRFRREDHALHLSSSHSHSFPPCHHGDYSVNLACGSSDWRVPSLHDDFCDAFYHDLRLRAQYSHA